MHRDDHGERNHGHAIKYNNETFGKEHNVYDNVNSVSKNSNGVN